MNTTVNEKYVAILLSTYNGEKYISEQLDSLISQNNENFTVFIRDDGSVDNTVSICSQYQQQHSDKIVILNDDLGNLGVTQSFAKLMELVSSELYMFCDQDDIWLPEKVSAAIKRYTSFLVEYPDDKPVFFFTDLTPFKGNKRIVAESFLKSINVKLKPDFEDIIFSVPTWGCTCFFNNNMKNMALPVPSYIRFHDSWMCILAFLSGTLIYVNDKEILYRLHDSNNSNAASTFDRLTFDSLILRLLKLLKGDNKGQEVLQRKLNQLVLALEKTGTEKKYSFYQAMTGGIVSRIKYFVWSKSLSKRTILLSPNLFMAVLKYKRKDD